MADKGQSVQQFEAQVAGMNDPMAQAVARVIYLLQILDAHHG